MSTVKSERVLVTPELAQRWLTERAYAGQRMRRDTHVRFLAEEMEKGRFLQGTPVAFATMPNGERKNLNGQHTLAAIALCGKSQVLTELSFPCRDDVDVAEMYGRFDVNLKRTISDLFAARGLANELGFTPTQLNAMGAAVKLIFSKFRSARNVSVHPDDLIVWIREYTDAAHMYFEVAAGMPQEIQKSVQRSATLGLALVTFRFSWKVFGQKVDEFWSGAIFDDGIKNGDPRKVAHRHLLNTVIAGAGNSPHSNMSVTAAYSTRYLASCFNAYMEGRPLQMAKVMNDLAPIKIIGTPFSGKE